MDRTRWRAAWAGAGVAALITGLGLSGCRADAGDPLATWVGKADSVCQQSQSDADAARPVLFQPSMADTLQKSADLSKDEAQQLRALDLPGERRSDARDYLGTLDDRVRELQLLATEAAHPGPDFQPPSLDELESQTQKAADQAQALGLKQCGAGIDLSIGAAATTTSTAPPGIAGDPDSSDPPPNPTDLNGFGQDSAG